MTTSYRQANETEQKPVSAKLFNLWGRGRLRNRIIILMIVAISPVLLVYSYINVRAQQQDLEDALLERAETMAISGSVYIGTYLEQTIENGTLTTEDVFDENYVKYFDFDASKYPEILDDPDIYDKFRTSYDAFTDKNWQKYLDSYLTGPEILYAVGSDRNGYVPTHNSSYSTGDGDPGTDRTKRIFSDEVGIKSSRNTEGILKQVYQQTGTGATFWDVSMPIYVNGQHWGAFRVGIALAENQARVQTATNRAVVATFVLLAIISVFALFLGGYITRPIEHLTAAAQKAAAGDLETNIDIPNRDEISVLANTFNQMTSQIREFISNLEQRVAERTKALTTVSEISTAASTILDIDILLQEVVNLSKERFDLYHSHIYLLDDAGENLVLTSGAGEVGRQMVAEKRSIPLDREQSLVARAARERNGVTINDVTLEPDFLPNPLLPDTRSELAVPMMVGEKVIGVFDVQSDIVGRFTDADIAVQITLASQIASAVQNARSYTELQHSQELLSDALRVARIGNWEYDLEKDLFTFNDHFYSIFRTSAEQVGGYKISSADYARIFVHPDDAALVGAEIQKSIESKERFFQANLEHRIIFADGEIGYITVNINLERDEDGKIIRWYGANQDVTERRQLEEITRGRAKREESLNRITQKIQGTTTMAEALQVVARELGHALGNKSTLVMLDPDTVPDRSSTFQGATDSVPNPETN